ncbi:hypothetical protein [Vibrio maerlii]|nr:hypothetical protein [Vibrio maerlii]
MGYELGSAYLGQIVAKQMIEEALYGKPKKVKKTSFFKRFAKKLSK